MMMVGEEGERGSNGGSEVLVSTTTIKGRDWDDKQAIHILILSVTYARLFKIPK
jgi:hypothetical protein